MLLAGIIVTIAFIMTALTLAQVSSLERQAATTSATTLSQEWRFVHERLRSNINTSMTLETSNQTFIDVIFPAIAETFRTVEAEKGYDVVLRLAGKGVAVNKTEDKLTFPTNTVDNIPVVGPADSVPTDGLIHYAPCRDTVGGPLTGCVGAVLVSVHLTDGSSTIEEVVLVGVNFP